MYIQYRLSINKYELIMESARPDEDNKAILRGDYLDKTQEGFVMPTRDEIIKQFIFPDWQQGDILVISNSPLKHPKLQGDTLVEMTREEVCESGDLSVLEPGEVWEDGKIKTIPRPKGVDIQWEYPNWIEKAPQDEVKKAHCDLIIDYQTQVLEAGFLWTHQHTEGTKTHKQRVRQAIDIPTLETAISTLADARMLAEKKREAPMITTYPWSFDDLGEDVCDLTEDELRELRLVGAGLFAQAVYKTANILKAQTPNMALSLEQFLTELKKHTNISVLANKE